MSRSCTPSLRRPRRRVLATVVGIVFAASSLTEAPVRAADVDPVTDLPPVPGRYLVLLPQEPAATYGGGTGDLEATRPEAGEQLDPTSPEVSGYRTHLRREQQDLAGDVGARASSSFTLGVNGFSATLSAQQVRDLSRRPGVRLVRDEILTVSATDVQERLGLLGSDGAWARLGGERAAGRGVVIGVLDTGIWPENPFFAGEPVTSTTRSREPGATYRTAGGEIAVAKADGGTFVGHCTNGPEFSSSTCNSKIVSARNFQAGFENMYDRVLWSPYETDSPRDAFGHGSHVASIAAGVRVPEVRVGGSSYGSATGVAPEAKLAVYKNCHIVDQARLGCSVQDTLEATEQAILDGVDVLNYSVGKTDCMQDNVSDLIEKSFLAASAAGILVVGAVGNWGPTPGCADKNTPWVLGVAATSLHGYPMEATLVLGDGQTFTGLSTALAPVPSAPMVLARSVGLSDVPPDSAAMCMTRTLDPAKVAGRIVFCEKSVTAALHEAAEVARAGGMAAVLVTTQPLVELHHVPSVQVNLDQGTAIRAYIERTTPVSPQPTQMPTLTLAPGRVLDAPAAPAPAAPSATSTAPSAGTTTLRAGTTTLRAGTTTLRAGTTTLPATTPTTTPGAAQTPRATTTPTTSARTTTGTTTTGTTTIRTTPTGTGEVATTPPLDGGPPTARLLPVDVDPPSPPPAPVVLTKSSRGPSNSTDGNLLKPDIAAPGGNILGATMPHLYAQSNFAMMTGTSMASPQVTGLAALLLTEHPDWSPMTVKSALMTTSRQTIKRGDGSPETDPFAQGAGFPDARAALDPGLVYDSGVQDWQAFSNGAGFPDLYPGVTPMDPVDFNSPSIAVGELPGQRTVQRTVTALAPGTYRAKASVEGFDVTVSPDVLTFTEAGQTATFKVTIRRVTAPLLEFRSGALVWSDERHTVRSPISVRAVSTLAPREQVVRRSSDSGSVTYPVGRSADSETAVTLEGPSAGQEFRETLVPGEPMSDTGGNSSMAKFLCSIPAGTSFARFDLVADDKTADFDLYVKDSTDPTSPVRVIGTDKSDERLDLVTPPAGIYLMMVHAFSAKTATSAFTLRCLSVGARPAVDATVTPTHLQGPSDETVPVRVSWTGLEADRPYMGIIRYSGALHPTILTILKAP